MRRSQLIELMKANTEKMNFQKNICFQMRNWAIVLTVGIITASYSIEIEHPPNLLLCQVCLHVFLLFMLIYLSKTDINWMEYFVLFRERNNLLERAIIFNSPIKTKKLIDDYFKYQDSQSFLLNKSLINDAYKKDFKVNIIYSALIVLTSLSLLITIYNETQGMV